MDFGASELIVEQFRKFLTYSSVDNSCLELLSDENVRLYVVNTINQLFEEYEDHKIWIDNSIESGFDVDTFKEILDAYFEGVGDIDKKDIFKWLIQLRKDINLLKEKEDEFKVEVKIEKEPLTKDSDSVGGKYDKKSDKSKKKLNPDIQNLVEMFPSMSLNNIEKFYKNYGYDYDRTIDNILLVYDKLDNEDLNDDSKNRFIDKYELTEEEKRKIKEETVKKYGFVKVSEDSEGVKSPLDHPIPLWETNKKLVRYYDSKVVTTKGEKTFFYKTEEDLKQEEIMKKTYVNLKPARAYRFH